MQEQSHKKQRVGVKHNVAHICQLQQTKPLLRGSECEGSIQSWDVVDLPCFPLVHSFHSPSCCLSCCPTSVKLYKNALLHSNFEFTHLPYNVCRLNRCEGGGAPCYEWWSLIHCTFIVHITTCKQTDRQVQTYSQSHNMSQEATYTKKAQ